MPRTIDKHAPQFKEWRRKFRDRPASPPLLPTLFAETLAVLERDAGSAVADPPLAERFLFAALVARAVALRALDRKALAALPWVDARRSLELGWLDDAAADPAGAELTKNVAAWYDAVGRTDRSDFFQTLLRQTTPPALRRRWGEHYTPDWTADAVVKS
ncbi:MAG: hypothetical protein ACRC1K_05680, partial [Planctomycetia bacterium]